MISKIKLAISVSLSLALTISAQFLTVQKAHCQSYEHKSQASTEQSRTYCQQIATQIGKSWQCTSNKSSVAEVLTFKITSDGSPYDIRLTSGFNNPATIKAALRATLLSMPFKSSSKLMAPGSKIATYQATCSFKGESQKPEVSLGLEEIELGQAESAKEILYNLPHKEKQNQADSIIRGWLISQLLYLNNSQFNLPESKALAEKMSDCLRQMGLNSNNPSDWKAFAGFLDPQIPIARNPDKRVMNLCDGGINAYFQAWKLDHNADTLESLAKIYDKKLACDCLAASKGDPVMLAAAAMLTDQYAEASELIETAKKAGSPDAQILAKLLDGTTDSDATTKAKSAATSRYEKNDIDWKTIVEWLPTDTETVIVTRNPITDPIEKERLQGLAKPEHHLRSIGAELPDVDNPNAKKIFEKSKITLSIGTGRAFRTPRGLGLGRYQGAKILLFATENTQVANQIMAEYRKTNQIRKVIEGTEVLVFDNKDSEHMSRQSSYIFTPATGVLVCATDEKYARQMLERIKSSPTNRAIENDLPLWKDLNTSSNFWAIRQYNRSSMPFDQTAKTYAADHLSSNVKDEDFGMRVDMRAIGLTVENRSDSMIVIKYFSADPSALQDKIEQWKSIITRPRSSQEMANPPVSDKNEPSTFKSSIDQSTATIEFKINSRDDGSIVLMILSALGHLVYI